MMLSVSRSIRASRLCRLGYLLCLLLVFSYILFEVLDLDGSDFPLKQHPLERAAVVAELIKEAPRAYSLERLDLWTDLPSTRLKLPREALWRQLEQALTFSPLNSVRTRGYRTALPRSSPSDPFLPL